MPLLYAFTPEQIEEFITLADPRLCLLSDGMEMEVTELPQHKITDFT